MTQRRHTLKQTLRAILIRLARPLLFLGFSRSAFVSLRYLPRYFRQSREFVKRGGRITRRYAILTDYRAQAGTGSGSCFHQDLLVASFIHKKNPVRHIDVGSRVDGFVAHVASFRPIHVLDIRPLNDTGHSNITFLQADLMSDGAATLPNADSVSCLGALEHFGLGRYSDPIDPDGHKKGFRNLVNMVETNGKLYISFPIGAANEVHFNAGRVFHPLEILKWGDEKAIKLERFDFVDDDGVLHQNVDLNAETIEVSYGCGIYTFVKVQTSRPAS